MVSVQRSEEKSQTGRIRITADLFPNLVLHVLACAGIGLDADYGQRYQETLTVAEIAQIQELAAGFHVQPPAVAGPLFQVLFQLPCYFPAETIAEIESIYERMVQVVQEGCTAPLSRSYPQQMELFARYTPPHAQKLFLAEIQARAPGLVRAIALFGQIVRAVYERCYARYWLEASERLERFGTTVLERIGAMDLVGAWESAAGREYPYPHFHAILGEPTRFLGTSLLAEKRSLWGHFASRSCRRGDCPRSGDTHHPHLCRRAPAARRIGGPEWPGPSGRGSLPVVASADPCRNGSGVEAGPGSRNGPGARVGSI